MFSGVIRYWCGSDERSEWIRRWLPFPRTIADREAQSQAEHAGTAKMGNRKTNNDSVVPQHDKPQEYWAVLRLRKEREPRTDPVRARLPETRPKSNLQSAQPTVEMSEGVSIAETAKAP
jgi:hypothetical protein